MVLNLLVICLFISIKGLLQGSCIGKAIYLIVPLNKMLYSIYKGCVIFKILESFNPF